MRLVCDPLFSEVDLMAWHFYLAKGSLSLVVNSPHGGMPTG
jgi:hypothetical protein